MKNTLEKTFPSLVFEDSVAISTSAIFTMKGVKLNEAILFDMIRRDPMMKYFLKIRETKTPYTFQKKPYFHFQHYADRFLPSHLRSDEEATINVNQISLDDENKIEIILNVSRVEQAFLISRILNRLFSYYNSRIEETENLLSVFVSEIPTPIEIKKERMKTLVTSHPIFDHIYFDVVPAARRPTVVSEPENDSISLYNKEGKKLFDFICSGEDFPIPSLRKNPNPNSEYKKLPYCRRQEEEEEEIFRDRSSGTLKAVSGQIGEKSRSPQSN